MIKHTNMRDTDELPFFGPQFAVGVRVRVQSYYHGSLKSLVDIQTSHVVKGVKEKTVDRMIFEGQPDDMHYRYQLVELEGVEYPISSDRFELAE